MLRKVAEKNIEFISELTDDELANYYMNAKALIMPQEEDFGLCSVEAQSVGTPVIAYKSGGALDTVVEGETGVFFTSQTVHGLTRALRKFDTIHFNKDTIMKNSERFLKERFIKEIKKSIKNDG